jgi:hypothetical protein
MAKARKKPRVMPLRAKHTKRAAKGTASGSVARASARSAQPQRSSLLLLPVGAAIAVFINLTHVLRRSFMGADARKMPPAPSRTQRPSRTHRMGARNDQLRAH